MVFLYLLIFGLFWTMSLCSGSIQTGTLTVDVYLDGDIVIAYDKIGAKMCGRYCIYQKSCTGINYSHGNRTCELLKVAGGEASIPQSNSFYSVINTWNMASDACHPNNPCSGRERCVKTVNGGYYCLSISAPCDDVVCQNGGTCKNAVSSFQCKCVVGTSGDNCEVTPCKHGPCMNGGTCSFSGTSYSCSCVLGFYGTDCESEACNPNPCNNGGVCTGTGGSAFTCTCATGWTGNTCQNSICDSIPCMYFGTCTPTGTATYACDCMAGFSGLQCQVTPCDTSNPCQYSGACYINGHTSHCSCPSGFSGDNCQITPCSTSPQPCLNSGTCVLSGSSYTCTCVAGYYGSNCQNTPCSSSPCKTGTCSITGSSYICTCSSSSYSGDNCELYYLGVIQSTNYPNLYPPSLIETFPLYCGYSYCRVRLVFDTFNVETNYDYVKVYDGSSSSYSLLGTLTGYSIPSSKTSSGPYMFVHFYSDHIVQKTGWRAHYYQLIV